MRFKPLALRTRPGFTLMAVVAAVVVVLAVSGVIYRHTLSQRKVAAAQEKLGHGDFSAEGLARIMLDRVVARSAERLGVIDSTDIAELNAEIAAIPVPDGVEIDTSGTRYTLAAVATEDQIPYDQNPLRVVSDQPRSAFDIAPDVAGVTAARTVEVMVVATVLKEPFGARSAVTRVAISKVLPFQRAIYTAGDLELCVSAGSQLLVDGRVRSDGVINSTCGGSRVITGDIYAQSAITVDGSAGGTHSLRTAAGDITLASLDRDATEADGDGVLEQYGGRVKIGAGFGDRMIASSFQSYEVAGSGECPDFSAACGGRGQYLPSITISKSNHAGNATFNVDCGDAYMRAGDPSGCIAQVNTAVTYTPYVFAGTAPTGTARIDPSSGTYWQGLFPDPRRESRCTASVDGTPISTYRCDTNAYGYVVDLARLGRVEGGLLTIRQTTNARATNNPSRHQEVVLLRNADVLYGPLTIHTDLPVYIAGSFNSYSPRPALIQAPMVTLLPEDYQAQLQKRSVWDETGVTPEPLRQAGRVAVHAILRTRYDRSQGASYYGGAIESAPHVLGNWGNADVLISGAIESEPWTTEASAYRTHHTAYNAIPAAMRPVQPAYRIVKFDKNYRDFTFQPPGSWSPENQPANNSQNNARTEARQENAAGGLSVVRMVQAPTRLPRDSALAILLPHIDDACDDDECTPPVEPPTSGTLSCAPSPAEDGTRVYCTASGTAGALPIAEFEFAWGDGETSTASAVGGSGTSGHTYDGPGTYTVRARAVDGNLNRSGVMETTVTITAKPPEINVDCDPTAVKPNNPDGAGEYTDCTVSVVKGTYDVARYTFIWGSGQPTENFASGALSHTASYRYASAGSYTVEMYVTDVSGAESEHETVVITARHLPPEITSFVCTPDIVEPGIESESCTVTYTDGTTSGQTFSINWGDGNTASAAVAGGSATVSHIYHSGAETAAADRSYTITGTITDLAGLTDVATEVVEVRTELPAVTLSCNPTSFYTDESTTCTASGSAGTFAIVSYHFDWNDPTAIEEVAGVASASATHTYESAGTYTLSVQAEDARGNMSAAVTQTLIVAAVTPPSTPAFSCVPSTIEEGESTTCTITGNAGTYPIDRYEIDWDDAAANYAGASTSRSHTYNADGSYTVRARTRDTKGTWSGWQSETLTVTAPAVAPAVTGFSCSPASLNTGVATSCTVNVNPGTAAISEYRYNCGGATTNTVASSASSYTFSCTYGNPGSKTVTVWVEDASGLQDSDTELLSVSTASGSATLSCPATVYRDVQYSCSAGASGGTVTKYVVDWGDGATSTYTTSATSRTLNNTYDASVPYGNKTMTVTVHFSNSTTASASAVLNLQQASSPVGPTVSSFTCSPASLSPGGTTTCTINANAGSAGIDRYEYGCNGTRNQTANTTATSFSFYCTYGSAGTYSAVVRVYDDGGLQASESFAVGVSASGSVSLNCPANAIKGSEMDCAISAAGATVSSYSVQWGDATSTNYAAGANWASHTYASGVSTGTKTVTLTGYFTNGTSASASDAVSLGTGSVGTVSCSVSPGSPAKGAAATVTVSYGPSSTNVTSVTWRTRRPNGTYTALTTRNPGNQSGYYSASVETATEGSYLVEVTATNTAGTSSNSCTYTVPTVAAPELVDWDCTIGENPTTEDKPSLVWYCDASADDPGASVRVTATLRNPSGTVQSAQSCSGASAVTGLGYAKCQKQQLTGTVGTWTIDATFEVWKGSATGPSETINTSYVVENPPEYECYPLITPPLAMQSDYLAGGDSAGVWKFEQRSTYDLNEVSDNVWTITVYAWASCLYCDNALTDYNFADLTITTNAGSRVGTGSTQLDPSYSTTNTRANRMGTQTGDDYALYDATIWEYGPTSLRSGQTIGLPIHAPGGSAPWEVTVTAQVKHSDFHWNQSNVGKFDYKFRCEWQ